MGKLEDVKVKLHVDKSTHPRFCKARVMPKGGPILPFSDTFYTKYRTENCINTDFDTDTIHISIW